MIKRLFFLVIIVFAGSILNQVSSQQKKLPKGNKHTPSKPPAFKDGGKTIQSLKTVYKCESIEFENWEKDDRVDSTLTVCLINSKNVLAGDADKRSNQLIAIARQIKNAVRYPEKFKSYYIIFVKRETRFGMTVGSHTAGADIPGKGL